MFKAKLKEAVICLGAGRVTLRYPFEPAQVPPKFRGKIEFDALARTRLELLALHRSIQQIRQQQSITHLKLNH